MVRKSLKCCKSLRCIERFMSGQADLTELRKQQEHILGLKSCRERTAMVGTLVPSGKKRGSRGSMKAGDTFVCNEFFCRAFGVSRNTIESAKGNPGACKRRR